MIHTIGPPLRRRLSDFNPLKCGSTTPAEVRDKWPPSRTDGDMSKEHA